MSLCLVLHDLPSGGAEVLESAIWEVSESHWLHTGDALLVATEVSVPYLASHLRGALRRSGMAGSLMVLRVGPDVVSDGLSESARSWVQEQAAEPVPG